MRAIIALAIKDLRLLLRDKAGFFFTFFFPLIYCMFFGAIFAGQSGGSTNAMKIAVIDEDGSDGSGAFIETLRDAPEIEVEITDRDKARSLVRRGKRVAYVILPEGFGESMANPFWGGDSPKLQTGIDPARTAEAGMLQGILTQYAYQSIQEAMTDPTKMNGLIEQALTEVRSAEDMDPVTRAALQMFLPALNTFMASVAEGDSGYGGFPQVEIGQDEVKRVWHGPTSSYEVSFPQGIIWGLLACSAAFGLSLVVERTKGTLVRLRMAPIARAQILAGKATACFFTTLALQVLLLGFGALVFKIRPDSIPLLALALVCASVGFVGIMMLLSVLGKTEQSAGGIGWGVLIVMAMTGGGMIPLFFMPNWLKIISHASPVKWAILGMEGAIWRGFSLTEMLLPCGILVGVGVVCFSIGVRAFSWTHEN